MLLQLTTIGWLRVCDRSVGAEGARGSGEVGDRQAHFHGMLYHTAHTANLQPLITNTTVIEPPYAPSSSDASPPLSPQSAMIDVRPFLELGGGESRAYFPARRVVSETGELSHCVLIVTDDAVLQVSTGAVQQ